MPTRYRRISSITINDDTGELNLNPEGGPGIRIPLADAQLKSVPPSGMYKVTNIYFDPNVNMVVVEYET